MNQKLITYKANGKPIFCKTINQERIIESIEKNPITFISGYSGTGKSYLAIAKGLEYLKAGVFKKIIITRPVVESGERLGHLPGDVMEKISPYIKPIQEFIKEILHSDEKKVKTRTPKKIKNDNSVLNLFECVEIAPLAFLRGSTFVNSYVILDEAQNTTITQMKMFLTRIGEGSKLVITGDDRQIDLPRNVESGLIDAISRLTHIEGVGHIDMLEEDIVRHGIIREILKAYEMPLRNY
jgi:phosphate starvation-inducible PhoH-like protein